MKLEDYSKYYIQGSDHYLIPKDEFKKLCEENQKLKGYKDIVVRFMKYLEENKMNLNNPNIFDFYMEIREVERNENNQ